MHTPIYRLSNCTVIFPVIAFLKIVFLSTAKSLRKKGAFRLLMTRSRLSAVDSTNISPRSVFSEPDHQKRKFEDFGVVDLLGRMKRHETDADYMAASQQFFVSSKFGENSCLNLSLGLSPECSYACESSNRRESTWLQLFVKMMSGGKTIVIHADKNDTVEKLHKMIELKTRVPVNEQRVIYKGKQLQWEHSLAYYSIEQDASLQIVGRMKSSKHPVAWKTVDDIMYMISRINRGEQPCGGNFNINQKLGTFFAMIPADNDSIEKYLSIFSTSSVPMALVMLYTSTVELHKSCAKSSIKLFLSSCVGLPKIQQDYCVPLVLDFCKLLRKYCPAEKLYVSCRNTLGSMLESFDSPDVFHAGYITIGKEIFPFFAELADLLVKELKQNTGPNFSDFHKFCSFWHPLVKAIRYQFDFSIPISFSLRSTVLQEEIKLLQGLYGLLLNSMDFCMCKVETLLKNTGAGNSGPDSSSCSQYLAILNIINSMSNLYEGAQKQVTTLIDSRKVSFSALIVKFAKRGDDHQWILENKEALTFEARRHLAMLLFPDVKEDFEEMHEMLIDRSNLLAESFEYIVGASPEALHGGLFMEFKNEEATGPGVLREWFYLVCQEIFNPRNTLFQRSNDDFRRFSPNPASKVDPLHPDFFEFTGRVIALSLMHKVQVGVLFDRVFFIQLTGQKITLEDIKDTDRIMYNSCKQILEMDAEFFDSNGGLGLTFVLETEEMGKRDTIELCHGGKFYAVTSKNRKEYVDLLIERRFATPISEHVKQFSRGFSGMLSDSEPSRTFFKRIYLEDLDGMLRGGENPISIDDWKAHTRYNGFKENDRQIDWFWKILANMTEEEQRSILFFWTSIKFVPVEGFKGLSSKLYIYRLYEANDRLPLSHTCFYCLCIPKYPTITLLEQRLRFIAQDHVNVSSSFGKW